VEAAVLNAITPLHPSSTETGGAAALHECVARSTRRYLADLDGTPCAEGLYALLLREVEVPLLTEVLRWCGGNQSRAAEALGINRATLRKKLLAHGLV
jgi:Fis family transcriptional regulator